MSGEERRQGEPGMLPHGGHGQREVVAVQSATVSVRQEARVVQVARQDPADELQTLVTDQTVQLRLRHQPAQIGVDPAELARIEQGGFETQCGSGGQGQFEDAEQ